MSTSPFPASQNKDPAADGCLEKLVGAVRRRFPQLPLYEQEPMAMHCSFRTGGPARALALPQTEQELLALCSLAREAGVTPLLLGNGTNLVFPDEGCSRFVLGTGKMQELCLMEEREILASAGVSLSRLASFACDNALTGLEFASGIPGTVGGGLLMNAGAYGGELKDCVKSVRALSVKSGEIAEVPGSACGFGYRQSVFQNGEYVLLSAVFRMERGEPSAISEKMRELNRRRREKQPLDMPSAGSTFRRPSGYYTAALIEECGLKGVSVGGAQVSEKHAGFIVNTGTATTKDLAELIDLVRKTVYRQKQITLQPEVILVR